MPLKNVLYIAVCNIMGLLLFFSWYPFEPYGFWFNIDKTVFYFFNDLLAENKIFAYFVAFVNIRIFDSVAFLFMLGIFFNYYRKSNRKVRRYMFCMGIAMLVSAFIIKQFDMHLPVIRCSPTNYFENVNLISNITHWHTKDSAEDSFPGDHGMFLLIFCGFMLKYFGKKAFFQSLTVFLLFSMPRIMGGAHWLTDIVVGSISIVLIILSWILLTPAADKFISWLESKIPLNLF